MKTAVALFTVMTIAAPRLVGAQAIDREPPPPRPPTEFRPLANPLWAIPLTSLRQTRLKPLFSPTRHPPPPVVAYVPPPPPKPLPRRPVPQSPSFTLVGTIIGAGQSVALVADPSNQKVAPLRLGEKFQGWRLRTVNQREIIVEKDISRAVLRLPKQKSQGLSVVSATSLPSAVEIQRSFERHPSNKRK